MAVSYRRSRAVPGCSSSTSFQRSLSPSGRFCSSSSSVFAAQTSSSSFLHRSSSPTRIKLYAISPRRSRSVRISSSIVSPRRQSISMSLATATRSGEGEKKRTCTCSPTTHPGSFRCSLHKKAESGGGRAGGFRPSNGLNTRRSAMTNSLVRIGSVEGDLVRRSLAALIRPSSHHQRRRTAFQPRPSRLSLMSKAEEGH